MRFLINASGIKVGGGVQVADSIIRELYKYPQHSFWVVASKALSNTLYSVSNNSNIFCFEYNIPTSLRTVFWGRDNFLDRLVSENHIDRVLTVFGPSKWRPKVPHICGFAKPQLVLPDSPFWSILSPKQKILYFVRNSLTRYAFSVESNIYFTENSFISRRLNDIFPDKKVFTITNNYNQIFDVEKCWDKSIVLPSFNGISLLTIASNYPHKNLKIIPEVILYLKRNYPEFNFRFILTIDKEDLHVTDPLVLEHIIFLGKVCIEQCPFLYKQIDIMFLPTLLECFSASYAEAMKMSKPILTSDLEFAHSLCGNAAYYFNPLSISDIGKAILKLSNDATLKNELVSAGSLILQKFDTFEERANKLVRLLETI